MSSISIPMYVSATAAASGTGGCMCPQATGAGAVSVSFRRDDARAPATSIRCETSISVAMYLSVVRGCLCQ